MRAGKRHKIDTVPVNQSLSPKEDGQYFKSKRHKKIIEIK